MKFKKRKHIKRLPPKSQYIPTWEEIKYCDSIGIKPGEYIDIKYENAQKAKQGRKD